MSIKNDVKAISKVANIASNGLFSSVYKAISDTYRDYLEETLENLIKDVLDNKVSEEKLIKFLEDKTNKRFVQNIIKKNLYFDNRIQTYILAKLWAQQIKNKKLNYYEQSLFTNINTFTEEDFVTFHNLIKKSYLSTKIKEEFVFLIKHINEQYELDVHEYVIEKFINNFVIRSRNIHDFGEFSNPEYDKALRFKKTEFTDILFSWIEEYVISHLVG